MPTLLQIVERQREIGKLATSGNVSVQNLRKIFHSDSSGSVKALQQKMYQDWKNDPGSKFAKSYPWAIILCRFKGLKEEALENDTEQLFRNMFTPGTGGLVEYWLDVSFGAIDITGSKIFGWVEIDIERKDAMGLNRSVLIDYAVKAARRNGLDPETGFHSQIAVFTHNFTVDGVPEGNPRDPKIGWTDPTWGKYCIDGSSDGRRVSAPPHGQHSFFLAHEMGHGFNMNHDLAKDLHTEYGDICCVMSNPFWGFYNPLVWNPNFGPSLCLPHLIQQGWMYNHRIYNGDDTWMNKPGGITLLLASITDPGAKANLGIKLAFKKTIAWDYYIEYIKPTGRNEGQNKPYLIIRRMAPYGGRETPALLGIIEVPNNTGSKMEFVETSGNVRFQVELLNADARIVKVSVKNL